jgi:glycolate oxidase FAD binding subunit
MSPVSDQVLSRLEAVVGAEHFSAEWEEVAQFDVDGQSPAALAAPGDAEQLGEIVRIAANERLALLAVGTHTKLDFGGIPDRYDVAVLTTRMNRVISYDPGDLTLSVEAGMRLSDLQAHLAEKNQWLPLDPPFAPAGTLGGILAAHSTGPLRHGFGTARDFLLGLEFVQGDGARVKSGARVVKSVAGYDLHKLMIGSLGTLGIITSVNFRTFPLPPASVTLMATFHGKQAALALRDGVTASPLQPRALEIASPRMTRLFNVPDDIAAGTREFPEGRWALLLSAAGYPSVVARHVQDFRRMAEEAQALTIINLQGAEEAAFWKRVTNGPYEMATLSEADVVMKVSVLPTHCRALLEAVEKAADAAEMAAAMLVRGPGAVYVTLTPDENDERTVGLLARSCQAIFEAASGLGGHGMIERCPTELKRAINIWGSGREDLPLMQKVKSTFDPKNVFAPGRHIGGI